jgi:hypothetical protein
VRGDERSQEGFSFGKTIATDRPFVHGFLVEFFSQNGETKVRVYGDIVVAANAEEFR